MKNWTLFLLLAFIGISCTIATKENIVTDEALVNAERNAAEWLSYGSNYSETRFSTLDQINYENADQLGLAWHFEMNTTRGVEATPLVSNGIMYLTGPWSILYALDAKSGKKLWEYDPKVPKEYGEKACCDVVNRGAALYKGKVYIASLDGRLIAIDSKTGTKVWETLTVDQSLPYTITGAPRVIKGNVIIGNGGAEYGVRGYLSAYDAETGKQVWRFYSVPGNPDLPFESDALEEASKTWTGEYWEAGGGGTMWDAMAYDPELNLMYVGTGNGSPWNRRHRSPDGGDNLYLSSIVALNPDTGEYVWHYQTTPGDNWDYTATQQLILADLEIEGGQRKVIMQAPKNGFFYVIDRTNGKFISGEPFVPINWASHIDYETGRPVENPPASYNDMPYEAVPGPNGAHNWHPMAFNPQTGLVYIPAQNMSFFLMHDPNYQFDDPKATMAIAAGNWNTGTIFGSGEKEYPNFGKLLAWDPILQKKAWEVEHFAPANGGVLTTAGNLVFQGTSDGRFVVYNAQNGEKLWQTSTGTGVIAAPITYELDGVQYISIAVGWGGSAGLKKSFSKNQTTGKLYTFKLDGKASMPEFPEKKLNPKLSGVKYQISSQEDLVLGTKLYLNYCYICHDLPAAEKGGAIPNLGYSQTAVIQNLEAYVLNRALASKGMPDFTGRLTAEDVEKIKAFIQYAAEAHE